MKINLTAFIFSIVFCFGAFYTTTPLWFLLGVNYQLSLICIFVPTIFWFLITETSTYIRILNSRYIFLIFALIFNFIMIRSVYSLRELLFTLALLPIIFSKKVGIKNVMNLLIILNLIFLFLTSFIEGINYLGLLDLNNWDASNLPWIKNNSPIYARTLRTNVCFFNPYFISLMEYIGTNGNCLISDSIRRVNFFWIEPTGVMISSSFLLLSYANGLFNSLRINIILLFIINLLSRSATSVSSLILIFFLRIISKITKFKMPKTFTNILALSLIPISIILLLKLIETYYPAKSESASVIFLIIKNFFSNISLFGNKDLLLSGDFRYNSTLYFGATSIPIRYGLVGLASWIITYVPFFFRSYIFIGFNGTNKNLRALSAYSALLISSILLLKQNSLFVPSIILIGEYVKKKFPNGK